MPPTEQRREAEDPTTAALAPLVERRAHGAILCDIDGTLAPIVPRPQDAEVPAHVADLLGELAQHYACVACISGRPACEARRLVGEPQIAYAGLHGAELLLPGASRARLNAAFAGWQESVTRFRRAQDTEVLRGLGVRIEDKGPIAAFHWRGAPDEDAAQAGLREVAERAQSAGLVAHWGRKVLEVRPPVSIDKGAAVRELVAAAAATAALYGGDDTTDLDAFEALDELVAAGWLLAAVRVGVCSAEGPEAIVRRADIVVTTVDAFAVLLERLLP